MQKTLKRKAKRSKQTESENYVNHIDCVRHYETIYDFTKIMYVLKRTESKAAYIMIKDETKHIKKLFYIDTVKQYEREDGK